MVNLVIGGGDIFALDGQFKAMSGGLSVTWSDMASFLFE